MVKTFRPGLFQNSETLDKYETREAVTEKKDFNRKYNHIILCPFFNDDQSTKFSETISEVDQFISSSDIEE